MFNQWRMEDGRQIPQLPCWVIGTILRCVTQDFSEGFQQDWAPVAHLPTNIPLLAFLPSLLISSLSHCGFWGHLPNELAVPLSAFEGTWTNISSWNFIQIFIWSYEYEEASSTFKRIYKLKEAKNQYTTPFPQITSYTPEIQTQSTRCFLYVTHKHVTLKCLLMMLGWAAQHSSWETRTYPLSCWEGC